MTTRELLHDALALTEDSFANENPKYIKKQKNKILFHTLLNIPFAKKWFSLIQSEEYKWVLSHRPRIYFKPFRVYMSTRWKKQQRMNALLSCYAFIKRRGYVIPEDVRAVVFDVLRHRIGITYEAEAENITSVEMVHKIVNTIEVP